jgi:Zn-dependent membrane protease YugP
MHTSLILLVTAIVVIVFALCLGIWAEIRVWTSYNKWKKVTSHSGMTGREAAEYVMREAGIDDVKINAIEGHLTDHYNPSTKELNLSAENYYGKSLAAIGVAAHEAGHAIQHKQGYAMLKARMMLVPATQFASNMLPFIIILGFFIGMIKPLAILGAAIYGVLTIFQLITLPVEFNASARAKDRLAGLGILSSEELVGVNDVLSAAALTYLAAFIASLGWLLYFLAASRDD